MHKLVHGHNHFVLVFQGAFTSFSSRWNLQCYAGIALCARLTTLHWSSSLLHWSSSLLHWSPRWLSDCHTSVSAHCTGLEQTTRLQAPSLHSTHHSRLLWIFTFRALSSVRQLHHTITVGPRWGPGECPTTWPGALEPDPAKAAGAAPLRCAAQLAGGQGGGGARSAARACSSPHSSVQRTEGRLVQVIRQSRSHAGATSHSLSILHGVQIARHAALYSRRIRPQCPALLLPTS